MDEKSIMNEFAILLKMNYDVVRMNEQINHYTLNNWMNEPATKWMIDHEWLKDSLCKWLNECLPSGRKTERANKWILTNAWVSKWTGK